MQFTDPFPQQLNELHGNDMVNLRIEGDYLILRSNLGGEILARVHITDIQVPE